MSVGTFELFDETLEAMVTGTGLDGATVAAVLTGASYTPDVTTHATFADITDELSGGDYAQVSVTGAAITDETDGIAFTTDDISFGSSVTISDAKYLVLVVGSAGSLNASDKVIGVQDLDTTSDTDTVSSISGEFTVQTPASGWFTISRS